MIDKMSPHTLDCQKRRWIFLMPIGFEVRWNTCFDIAGEAGSHINTLDGLINARYVVLDLLDKMRALRTTFEANITKGIKEVIELQEKDLVPQWDVQMVTLPANRALQLALLAKCPGLVTINSANNRLQNRSSLSKRLK